MWWLCVEQFVCLNVHFLKSTSFFFFQLNKHKAVWNISLQSPNLIKRDTKKECHCHNCPALFNLVGFNWSLWIIPSLGATCFAAPMQQHSGFQSSISKERPIVNDPVLQFLSFNRDGDFKKKAQSARVRSSRQTRLRGGWNWIMDHRYSRYFKYTRG